MFWQTPYIDGLSVFIVAIVETFFEFFVSKVEKIYIVINIKNKRMKRLKLIYDGGFRLAIMSMLALFAFTSCSAHPCTETPVGSQTSTKTDSVMRSAVGDNIYKFIVEAKKITAEEIKLANDTTKVVKDREINIKSKYIPLVHFILTDPKIYHGDLATYGNFMPCFKLSFIKKKEIYILNFDFGLKKWNVCDGTGKQIKMFDLSSDDMLRLANMLFPQNELYKNLINTDKR